MANLWRYFVQRSEDGRCSLGGDGNTKRTRVNVAAGEAARLAHYFAGIHGVVEFRGPSGKFERECDCPRCKRNR